MNNDLTSKHELAGKISYCLWKYQHEHRDSIKIIADISNEILGIIENAQPVEQPQGEWIIQPHSMIMKCSLCGHEENAKDVGTINPDKHFCFFCGAKMKQG